MCHFIHEATVNVNILCNQNILCQKQETDSRARFLNRFQALFDFFICLLFMVVNIELRDSHMLGKVLHPQASFYLFWNMGSRS